jgi:hypothetical protein
LLHSGAADPELRVVLQMTSQHRITTIVDHALAARRLAVAQEQLFLTKLLDMLLLEAGKVLVAQAFADVPERSAVPTRA